MKATPRRGATRFVAWISAASLATLVAPAGCTTASRGVAATDGGAADGAALEPEPGADAAGDASDDASGGGFEASSNCGSPGLPCCEHACTAGCCDGPTQLCAVTCGVTGGGDD